MVRFQIGIRRAYRGLLIFPDQQKYNQTGFQAGLDLDGSEPGHQQHPWGTGIRVGVLHKW